jgi:hypothetical protein
MSTFGHITGMHNTGEGGFAEGTLIIHTEAPAETGAWHRAERPLRIRVEEIGTGRHEQHTVMLTQHEWQNTTGEDLAYEATRDAWVSVMADAGWEGLQQLLQPDRMTVAQIGASMGGSFELVVLVETRAKSMERARRCEARERKQAEEDAQPGPEEGHDGGGADARTAEGRPQKRSAAERDEQDDHRSQGQPQNRRAQREAEQARREGKKRTQAQQAAEQDAELARHNERVKESREMNARMNAAESERTKEPRRVHTKRNATQGAPARPGNVWGGGRDTAPAPSDGWDGDRPIVPSKHTASHQAQEPRPAKPAAPIS